METKYTYYFDNDGKEVIVYDSQVSSNSALAITYSNSKAVYYFDSSATPYLVWKKTEENNKIRFGCASKYEIENLFNT